MNLSRRIFIKSAALMGGSLLLKGSGLSDSQPTPRTHLRPAYLELEEQGLFSSRVEEAFSHLEQCDLCPRRCGVNRLRGEIGICRAPQRVVVNSTQPHFGEEFPLVGGGGSGTIFFSNCNLRCVFCQNWPIAHEGRGRQIDDQQLAEMMLSLQRIGCLNINVVTPTHVMPHILRATRMAMQQGLRLPICYNTGGYERVEILRLLDGIVDIYLPDLKMMDGENARRYLGSASDYPGMAQAAILEMQRQVGVLATDSQGIAERGLMIRHLVMPNQVAGTREFIEWVAENLPASTYVNIMSQYRVEHRAFEHEAIARAITPREFVDAMTWAIDAGLTNLDQRSMSQYGIFSRRG